jgi:hypothetical protein
VAVTRIAADAEADAVAVICEEATALLTRINWLLEHNSDLSIAWEAAQKPACIEEDAAGNMVDRRFSRQNVANAVGSLDQIRKLLTNQSVNQGDHLGNLNLMARPLNRG